MAVTLRVPVETLWSGAPPADKVAVLGVSERHNVGAFLASPEAEKMASAYARLPRRVQERLADLAPSIADQES